MNLLFQLFGIAFSGPAIVPILTALGAIVFHVLAYKSGHSGHTQQLPGNRGTISSDENTPNVGFRVFAWILTAATIGIMIWQHLEA